MALLMMGNWLKQWWLQIKKRFRSNFNDYMVKYIKEIMIRLIIGFKSSFDPKLFIRILFKGIIQAHPVHKQYIPRITNNFLKRFHNDIIFCDIGCNRGVISERILNILPEIKVVGFEPQESNHPILDKVKKKIKNFSYRKIGLGDKKENLTFYQYENDGLSSLLKLDSNYTYGAHGGLGIKKYYKVEVSTLDNEFLNCKKKLFLKIDTQGFELKVLKGAKKLFDKNLIWGISIELMIIKKYEKTDGALWQDLTSYLYDRGFLFSDFIHGFREKTGIMTEFDALFLHTTFIRKLNEAN
jgi:FkbM family methyltransferase